MNDVFHLAIVACIGLVAYIAFDAVMDYIAWKDRR